MGMLVGRRRILQVAVAFGLVGTRSWAATEATFGDFALTTVSDGKLLFPVDTLIPEGQDAAAMLALAGAAGDTYESPLNVTLLRRGADVILFDAGSGPDFVPTAGLLVDGLAAIDVAPEDVTHVIFTHGHPDHLWGVLDDFDEPLFASAAHMIGAVERDFWVHPDTLTALPAARQSFAAGASRRIEAMGDALAVFGDGDEVAPGITARMTPGHTPGHMAFMLGDQAAIMGDVVTNLIGFARPDLPSANDHDTAQAAATRAAMLAELAASGLPMVGYHMPGGGIGTVSAADKGFAFKPM